MAADGALDKKLNAYIETQRAWADAFSKYTGNVSPQIVSGNGGSNSNAAVNFMDIMSANAQRQLLFNMKADK
jgi:hypothetical protein